MDMEDVLHSQCWPQRENIPTGIFIKTDAFILTIQVDFPMCSLKN